MRLRTGNKLDIAAPDIRESTVPVIARDAPKSVVGWSGSTLRTNPLANVGVSPFVISILHKREEVPFAHRSILVFIRFGEVILVDLSVSHRGAFVVPLRDIGLERFARILEVLVVGLAGRAVLIRVHLKLQWKLSCQGGVRRSGARRWQTSIDRARSDAGADLTIARTPTRVGISRAEGISIRSFQAMHPPPFSLTDWHRFLFGNASWPFLVEVLARTTITFVLLIVAMRLLGRRVAAQYTLLEVSIVVTLAAAVGVPLQASSRGMLPPFLIAAVVIVLQRALTSFGVRHRRVENFIATDISLLVRDGQFHLPGLIRTGMPRERIFEVLRLGGCQQLGQISRLYMEPSGKFSFVRLPVQRPGLPVIPEFDKELLVEARASGCYACRHCGHVLECADIPLADCDDCGRQKWVNAVGQLRR